LQSATGVDNACIGRHHRGVGGRAEGLRSAPGQALSARHAGPAPRRLAAQCIGAAEGTRPAEGVGTATERISTAEGIHAAEGIAEPAKRGINAAEPSEVCGAEASEVGCAQSAGIRSAECSRIGGPYCAGVGTNRTDIGRGPQCPNVGCTERACIGRTYQSGIGTNCANVCRRYTGIGGPECKARIGGAESGYVTDANRGCYLTHGSSSSPNS
jgi:hypothetical protein